MQTLFVPELILRVCRCITKTLAKLTSETHLDSHERRPLLFDYILKKKGQSILMDTTEKWLGKLHLVFN